MVPVFPGNETPGRATELVDLYGGGGMIRACVFRTPGGGAEGREKEPVVGWGTWRRGMSLCAAHRNDAS